jgi:hypothetical protein
MVAQSLTETNTQINELREKLAQKEVEIDNMKERAIDLEFEVRKKNLLLFKIAENERDKESLFNGITKLIREVADPNFTEMDIDDAYRLGKKSNTPRPIIHVEQNIKKKLLA